MPGIATTRTSIPLGGRGLSGDAYWIWFWERSGDFLFFASDSTNILNKVAATQLSNQVTGAVDFLTVTGTGLNARYRTPDNATYRTADSDYVFWKSDASESTCDGNRLIGYDFPRILVKYLNVAPYTILWIGILKPGVTVTNAMRDSFDLNLWWDNTLSFHGNTKQNKPLPQQYAWTAESVIEAETAALVARMTAVSETPDAARITVLDTAIAAAKTAGIFTDVMDAQWLLASHGNDSALLNIIKASHNITLVNTPTFLADRHYVGNGTDEALNCNYNPSTEASKYLQNACSFGVYIRNNISENTCALSAENIANNGILLAPRWAGSFVYVSINAVVNGIAGIINTQGMWIVSRTANNNYYIYHNGISLGQFSDLSAALVNVVLHLLCRNTAGTLSDFASYQVALAFVGGVMNQTKVTAFQTIWVDGYLDSIGAKV
jgi:hypothetical protein